ncbi:hypothetical protein WR25_00333 [Diploscapter pachys]|uniref:mitogen-activated protein kinase kinase n=1 Tax=Diploscapter pachys TaxID=2018661 RepID=A0A2A2L6J4_9BILA|nr:hypothetical protein WR25_00333 [Diploscapter pachys]
MNEIVDDDMNGLAAHESGHCNENGTENDDSKYNLKTTENDKYQLLVLIGSMRNGSDAGCELIELPVEIAKCYEKTIEFFRQICAFNLFESVDDDEADMIKFGKDVISSVDIEDVEEGFAGQGASGTVTQCLYTRLRMYRGRSLRTKVRHCAPKSLVRNDVIGTYLAKKTIKYDAQSESKIRKEIANLSKCSNYENQSEFIVIYYGHSHDIGYEVNIYLEWMDKFSIDKYLPIPINVLSHVSRSILEGLKVMFDNKIMHRDLKPVNILVNSEGFVKLGDFGISKKEGTENGRNPKYGKKSEIWNYGICLWEMYKGDYPYHENGCEFIKEAIKSGIGRYAQEDIQYTPLRDLIVGCVENDLSKRWTTKQIENCEFHRDTMPAPVTLQWIACSCSKRQNSSKYNPLVKRRQVLLQSRRG